MRSKKEYPYVDEIDGVEVVYFNPDFIVGRWAKTIWNSNTKNYYLNLGYEYTGYLTEFIVDVRDLTRQSGVLVNTICPFCREFRWVKFYHLKNMGHTKCTSCFWIIDEVGKKYGRLTVMEFSHISKHNLACWKCICKCGNNTIVKGNSLRRGETKSCGCLNKERPSGPANPRWNPNLTDEDRAKKRTSQWHTFSLPVFKRDDFICQISGERGGNLEAHHLEDNSTNPEMAFDINNGITTRRKKHREFHKWKGGTFVSCTKQDMIEFCRKFYPDAPFLKST